MMVFDTPITIRIVACATEVLNVGRADLLQNLGTYLVSRFGVVDFHYFFR